MKNLILILLVGIACNLSAQQKKIIKKEMESNASHMQEDENSKVKFEVIKELVNGKEVTSYVLEKESNGEKEVTKWDGEGEMPSEIKAQLEKSEKMGNSRKEVKIIEEKEYVIEVEDGESKKVMKWDGEGEMPEGMKNAMEEYDVEIEVDDEGRKKKRIIMKEDHSSKYDVKVRMGIGLDQGPDGVRVDYVQDDSPASKAGIKAEDTVLKINDAYIFTNESLMKELSKYKAGDKIKVTVLRDKSEKNFKLTLEAKN